VSPEAPSSGGQTPLRPSNLHRAAINLGGFILVHEFKNGRRVGRARIPFPTGLKQMAIESFCMPRQKGLSTKMGRQTEIAAYDFTSDNGQVDLVGFPIAQYQFELGANGIF
jgi:hypothetical protein